MVLAGQSVLDIVRTLYDEDIPSGTLGWGKRNTSKAPPVREPGGSSTGCSDSSSPALAMYATACGVSGKDA